MQKELLGIIYYILSTLGYSTIALINKGPIINLNTFQVFFLSSVACLLFTIVVIKIRKKDSILSLTKSIDKTYFFISSINFISLCSTLYAIKTLNLTTALSIGYMTPVLVSILAVLIFKERLSYKVIIALLTSILGAIIITKPMMTDTVKTWGIVAALVSALGWALHKLILKKQALRDHWTKQTFLTLILTSLISFPFAIATWQPLTNQYLGIFFVLGIFYTLSKMFLMRSLNATRLIILAPISYTKLIVTAIFSYILFEEVITLNIITGSILIVISTILVMHSTKQTTATVSKKIQVDTGGSGRS